MSFIKTAFETETSDKKYTLGHRAQGVNPEFVQYFPSSWEKGHVVQKETENLLRGDTLPYVERERIAQSNSLWLKFQLAQNPEQNEKIVEMLCREENTYLVRLCLLHTTPNTETLEYLVEHYKDSSNGLSKMAQGILNSNSLIVFRKPVSKTMTAIAA